MNRAGRVGIAIAAALSPRRLRETRREQWLADARDAADLGLAPSGVVLGALWAALAPRRRQSPANAHHDERKASGMALRGIGSSLTFKVVTATAGLLLLAGTGTGEVATWVSSAATIVSHGLTGSRVIPSGSVVASLEDGPAPEQVDLSTLIIVGEIDPATGQITEFATPRHLDAAGNYLSRP